MSRPPLSKVTPLPTSVTFGASSRPQAKSTILGASAAARPTAWTSGKLAAIRSSPRIDADAGAEILGELAPPPARARAGPSALAGALTRSRPKATAAAIRSIRAASTPVGRDEPGLRRRIGLEAGVAVEREQKAERGEVGVGGRIGETIDAFGQRGREFAGGERIARRRAGRFDAEQRRPPSAPPSPGRSCNRPGLRLEAAALGEGRGRLADRGLHRLPVVGADEPDRNGVGRRQGESGQGPVSMAGRSAAAYHGFAGLLHAIGEGRAIEREGRILVGGI